ncbi:Leucine-rich repeat neuronal protein 3 [Trichinella sp. T9]|nr:Leucine-rich repeat neuronal protein 3 [Trichinella sp. T9]
MYKMHGIVLLLTTLNLFTKSQLSLNNSSAEMLVCVPKYGPCSCEQEGIVNCNGEKLETVNLKIANDNGVVVEQLNMQDNMLTKLRKGLSSLLELSMENTKLSFIPEDAFKSLNHLEVLSLRNNQLETVPQLNNLNKLNRLVLSGNPILRVNTYAFQLYPNLENIQLRHMPQLTLVEDCAFCFLNHLNTIAITDSPLLKWIDPFAFGSNISLKYNLKIVDFSNNNLQSLDKELLPWENVTKIQLANNSFKCDASLNWIFDIRKKLHGNINCNQKNDLNGNFTIFKKDNSCCSKNSRILFSFPVLSGSSCGIGFSTEKIYGGFICLPSKLHFFICIKILQLLMIQKNSLTLIMMFHHGTFNYTKKDISKFIRWQFNSGGA